MRCYFLRDGHIAAVEVLSDVSGDDDAIKQACVLYVARLRESFDGFEVWDGARKLYRYPELEEEDLPQKSQIVFPGKQGT